MPDRPDVIVVGNGALGLFTARALAATARVTLVGPAQRPGGASAAAGAMLGCFGEVTKDTFATEAGRAKFELGLLADEHWPAVLDELAETAADTGQRFHHVPSTHVVLNGCGGPLDSLNYDAVIDALGKYRRPWSEVGADRIPGYHPRPDGRALRALHMSGEGAVDGNQVIGLVEERLRRSGVRIHDESVEGVVVRAGAVAGVRLRGGEVLEAEQVVVAAGSRTVELLRTALDPGEVQPMLSGVGVALVTQRTHGPAFETVVRTPNRGGACGLHLVPLGEGREYIGATNLLSPRPQTLGTIGTASAILDQVARQLDETASAHTIVQWRVGNRPVSLDGFPLVGWTSVPGLYVLSGTYRDGFHAAPALAAHAAAELAGSPGLFGPVFAPGRTLIRSWGVEESVEEYALHMTSLWFELGGRVPSQISSGALTDNYREEARSLYRRTGIEVGLGPDVLACLTGARDPGALTVLLRYLRAAGLAEQPVAAR